MIEILIPFYGDPALLRVAVQSVLDQDDPRWRLVVVDNHYPDPEPGQWVEQIDDSRVTYVRNERNLGVSGNLRKCLAISTADHVVIMGADDVMHANYVSSVTRAIEAHPDAAAYHPRVRVIDEQGKAIQPLGDRIKAYLTPSPTKVHVLGGSTLATSLLRGNWLYFPALAWSRTALEGRTFRADMETVFDLDFIIRTIVDGSSLVLMTEEAFSYRRHATSVSSVTARDTARFEEEARLFAELVPTFEEIGWHDAARAARRHTTSRLHALALLPGSVRSGDVRIARLLAQHALKRTPGLSRR